MTKALHHFGICVGAGLLGLNAACTAPAVDRPTTVGGTALLFYPAQDIVVGTRNTGTFQLDGGCIVFERDRPANSRSPVLFPTGSAWSEGKAAVRLPNRQSIPFGRKIEIAYEAPPPGRSTAPGCPGNPIHLLNVVEKE